MGMETTDKEMVNHPQHYNQGSIECIDAMVSAFGKEDVKAFCKINAFKYLCGWQEGRQVQQEGGRSQGVLEWTEKHCPL